MRYHRCYILTVRKKPEDLYPANFWAQWASWYYPSNAMVLRLDAMVHDRSHHGQVMFQLQQQLELFPKFHRQFLVDHLGKQVQKHSKKSDRKTPWWNSKWVFVPCFFSTKNDGVFSPKKWPPPPLFSKQDPLVFCMFSRESKRWCLNGVPRWISSTHVSGFRWRWSRWT